MFKATLGFLNTQYIFCHPIYVFINIYVMSMKRSYIFKIYKL